MHRPFSCKEPLHQSPHSDSSAKGHITNSSLLDAGRNAPGTYDYCLHIKLKLYLSRRYSTTPRSDERPTITPIMAAEKDIQGPDPIILTLFANRFMSVAEAMGRSLQQTSISTNIKERLDFSCALFAPDGDLVANAPFIPIHLGSMSL